MNAAAGTMTPAPEALASVETEAALLGCMIQHNDFIDFAAEKLGGEDFFEPVHGRIFQAALDMYAMGETVRPFNLIKMLVGDTALESLGGAKYLATISSSLAGLIGFRSFVDHVADLAARRRLVMALTAATQEALDTATPLSDIVDRSDAALVSAVEKREAWATPTAGEAVDAAIERIATIKANEGRVGAASGIDEFDQLLGGFEPGQLVIGAARPSMGKTALACSVARGLAANGHGVLFVSLEMSATELGMRIMSDHCYGTAANPIPFEAIQNANLSNAQMLDLSRAREQLNAFPLRIIDAGSVTMGRLSLGVRRIKRQMAAKDQSLKVVIVDYLQLLNPDQKTRSVYEAVSEISRGLKALAKDTGVAIFALAQLSRSVETRESKIPILSDLRDSGQIEQDADSVMFLHREEYYLERTKPKQGFEGGHEEALAAAKNKLGLHVAKRRNGRVGHREVNFFGEYQAVRSIER